MSLSTPLETEFEGAIAKEIETRSDRRLERSVCVLSREELHVKPAGLRSSVIGRRSSVGLRFILADASSSQDAYGLM